MDKILDNFKIFFKPHSLNIIAFDHELIINQLVGLYGENAGFINTPKMKLDNYMFTHVEADFFDLKNSIFEIIKSKINVYEILIIGLAGLSYDSVENLITRIFDDINLTNKLVILLQDNTNQLIFKDLKFISIS